ncbi:hypothetical protein ElyMa_005800400 [Elysia marginata]|uniref:Uncharacterized protein n=1 Tax=Elysia marginata TaxID=1093978 RepID=A0AAV4FVW5_9GAST|nr:hypothetical protein ElyMa_005800400 [Elysia marginata]
MDGSRKLGGRTGRNKRQRIQFNVHAMFEPNQACLHCGNILRSPVVYSIHSTMTVTHETSSHGSRCAWLTRVATHAKTSRQVEGSTHCLSVCLADNKKRPRYTTYFSVEQKKKSTVRC